MEVGLIDIDSHYNEFYMAIDLAIKSLEEGE